MGKFMSLRAGVLAAIWVGLSFCPPAFATPSVSSATVRLGFSLRFKHDSIGLFSCEITNPDDVRHEVKLRLVPAESFLRDTNNFSDAVEVPPQCVIRYEADVILESSEKYLLEVLVDDRKLPGRAEELLIKFLNNKEEQIGLITGDNDISLGGFPQLPAFKEKVFATSFTGANLPELWSAYRSLSALVVLSPDYEKLSSRQYQAILDYVRQGGILIFAWPEGAFNAATTPLADLLPVTPLKPRHINRLPPLKKMFPAFTEWEGKGVTFLESALKPNAVCALKWGEFPVIAWKKYGLGACRFVAVPITEEYYPDKKLWTSILEYFFNHQRFYPETEGFKICLDEMTGFDIPARGQVWLILIVYLALLTGLAAMGVATRRNSLAWLACAALAVIATLSVLGKAAAAGKHKGKLLSALEFRVDGAESSPAEAYYGLFSNANAKITVVALTEDATLRDIPPNSASIFLPGTFGASTSAADPGMKSGLQISKSLVRSRLNGLPRLVDIDLKARSTRQFSGDFSGSPDTVREEWPAPELVYEKGDLKMTPWPLPPGVKAESAFLLFPMAAFPLRLAEGKAWFDGFASGGLFTSDSLSQSLRKAMAAGYKKDSPALCLVRKTAAPLTRLSEDAACHGRDVLLFPVREICRGGKITLRPEQIVFTSGDNSSRMIMPGNTIKETGMGGNEPTDFTFSYKIPPVFSGLVPDEILVYFNYLNPGGNIGAQPRIVTRDGQKLEGKQIQAGVYRFAGANVKDALDPITGTGSVMIDSEERSRIFDPGQKMRANYWAIKRLGVSVKGTLPAAMAPVAY